VSEQREAPEVLPAAAVPPAADLLAAGQLEALLSLLLRSGVALSLTLVLGGMCLSFVRHPDYLDSPEALEALLRPDSGPASLSGVLEKARLVHGQGFVMLGLLVMMTVPVLRLGLAWLAFRQRREWPFVWVTSTVLALLALSLLLGRVAH
jgi:uncharacterized membrane protein